MGGRLTDFSEIEILDLTGGRPRPVDGVKGQSVPIGSHILGTERPNIPEMDRLVGYRGLDISLTWPVRNESPHNMLVEYRIMLVQTKAWQGDAIWFDYNPKNINPKYPKFSGVHMDKVWNYTRRTKRDRESGQTRKIVTHHGASKNTRSKPVVVRAGGITNVQLGIILPGTGGGGAIEKFWNKNKHSTFKLFVAIYQVEDGGKLTELGKHEFKDILELRVPARDSRSGLSERARERFDEQQAIIQRERIR